jgi:hypothetical protein
VRPASVGRVLKTNYMKEEIYKICTQLNNGQIDITQATEQLLDLFAISNSALIEGCKTVVDGYEGDGMENMKNRDEVFYEWCKRALGIIPNISIYATMRHTKLDNMKLDFGFGDYCTIEQHRYGCKNEHYAHKVIGTLKSNAWVDVPVTGFAEEVLHDEMEDVVACVCCGVDERRILRYRLSDVRKHGR